MTSATVRLNETWPPKAEWLKRGGSRGGVRGRAPPSAAHLRDKALNMQESQAVWFPHHERPPNALWLEEPRGIDRRNAFGTEVEEKEKSQMMMLHDCKPNRNTHKLLKCRRNQTKPK